MEDDKSRLPEYEDLHAIVVDAIRYVTAGQDLEIAAAEVLNRLRAAGLPIPKPAGSAK